MIGHDIKVMGVRQGSRISLTIGCAMIGRHLNGIDEYLKAKIAVRQVALEAARSKTDLEVDAVVNAADDLDQRRELPADRWSADQRAALARVPTDGGQKLPLNNTLIEVELE